MASTQDIAAELEQLRATIESARSMPMSASVVINKAEVLELIERLEATITSGLSQASTVVGDREAVVAAGHAERHDILQQAERDREDLVSETAIFQVARAQADDVRTAAEQESASLRAEADAYVEEKLANFELSLERTLDVVRRGRARLTSGNEHRLGDDGDVDDIELPEHLRPRR